jgi:hypothetical protein
MRKIYFIILSSLFFSNGFTTGIQVGDGEPLKLSGYITYTLPEFKGAIRGTTEKDNETYVKFAVIHGPLGGQQGEAMMKNRDLQALLDNSDGLWVEQPEAKRTLLILSASSGSSSYKADLTINSPAVFSGAALGQAFQALKPRTSQAYYVQSLVRSSREPIQGILELPAQ